MKMQVSTIWLRTLATADAEPQQPRAFAALQPAEDRDVQEGGDAISEDPAEPDSRRSAHHRFERRQPRGIHVRRRRQAQNGEAEDERGEQRHEADQHQPIRDGAAMKLGDCARCHDEQQEGEDPRFDRERAERDLLVAEHAGDTDHAAVEDREREQGWRNGGRSRRGLRDSSPATPNSFAAQRNSR